MKKTILSISAISLLLLGGCENKKDLLLGEWKEKGIEDSYLIIDKNKIIVEYDYEEIGEINYKFKNKEDNKFELFIKSNDSTMQGKFLNNNKEIVIYQEGEDGKEVYEKLE